MPSRSLLASAALAVVLSSSGAVARAQPASRLGQAVEDLFADGEVDAEDIAALRLGAYATTSDLHGGSWVSLVGFTRQLATGGSNVGAAVIVGLALDRVAEGRSHGVTDPATSPPAAIPAPAASAPAPPPPPPLPANPRSAPLSPHLARQCVAAALRATGLGVDDARLDDLIARARASAWLPETRVRAERVWADDLHLTTVAPTDPTTAYDALNANFLLELRLTWRLDRLLYAGDEPTIERVRLERQQERMRVSTQVLDVLFAWDRARMAEADAPAGSAQRMDATVRMAQAQATLDVLTGGWFSLSTAGGSRAPGGGPP